MDKLKPFVAFVNDNITESIRETLVQRLFVSEVISFAEFQARMISVPTYIQSVHNLNRRVLVLTNFSDESYPTYADQADLSLFCRNGLVRIGKSKVDNVGLTFPIATVQIFELLVTRAMNTQLSQEDVFKRFYNDQDRPN